MAEQKQNGDSIFLRIPKGKQVNFIDQAHDCLFIKLKKKKKLALLKTKRAKK